jgi:hypothetical protein
MSILLKKLFKRFRPAILGFYSFIEYLFKYRKYRAIPNVKKCLGGTASKPNLGEVQYLNILERLTNSYNKAKQDPDKIDRPYHVGSLWQKIIDDRFSDLISSIKEKNIERLKVLLENFHKEKFTVGSGGSADDYFGMKKSKFYQYQLANTWCKYYNVYDKIRGVNHQLTYPQFGNPIGLFHNKQIIPIEAIRYHYYGIDVISLLRDIIKPVVCEIGSGLGGQAYATLSNSNRDLTYILLDIPEMLIISSYFLMTAFPNKKFLLYGENTQDYANLDQYDIILLPNFMLPQLSDETVDLFFNESSFSEMNRETVEEYIFQIERVCRKYFMHINHDAKFVWYENEKKVENLPGSQINPDLVRFKRIYKHPRLFARLEDRVFYYSNKADHFAFLYERIKS